jgi:hypothetical protein
VTTQAATNVQVISATGNGNIVATGGENCDLRGVRWGVTSGAYTSSSTDSGSFGIGAFTKDMTSLTASTTYYYQAMAHNSSGWGYGVEQSFTTASSSILILRPNGAGDETNIASQYPSSDVHWDKVDEASQDDNSTYIYTSSTAGQRDLYNLPASGGSGTINFIKIYLRAYTSTIGYARPSMKSGSIVTDGSYFELGSSWTTYSQQWGTNPADGEAWEWSDIDALQIGVYLIEYGGGPFTVYCTQVYAEVNYTPGTSGPSSVTASPGTMADDATVGTVAWTNPDNAKVSDNIYAYLDVPASPKYSHYLKATNFGFSIATEATITGILVEIERRSGSYPYGTLDYGVKIVKADGSIGSTNKAVGGSWPASDTYKSYGGSADLWGETWTAADINDADFGMVLQVLGEDNRGDVDHIRITVYYTGGSIASPTVTTQAASNIQATTVTGNGTITATGGENCDLRGVRWGVTSGTYTSSSTDSGSFSTGAFTKAITGLATSTTYYYQAMAHNSAGWSYGAEQSFTTASSVTASPLTMADNASIGTTAWIEPDRAKVADSLSTYTVFSTYAETSHYLKATNFGLAIPLDGVISGIKVEARAQSGGSGAVKQNRISIVKPDGSVGTTNKSAGTVLTTSLVYYTFGGPTDLWGETWTPQGINDADFGAVFAVEKVNDGLSANGMLTTSASPFITQAEHPLRFLPLPLRQPLAYN